MAGEIGRIHTGPAASSGGIGDTVAALKLVRDRGRGGGVMIEVPTDTVVTGSGRRLVTGRFRVPAAVPIRRVTLRIEPGGGRGAAVWVSLTAAEAVRLAQALLVQAQAIDADG